MRRKKRTKFNSTVQSDANGFFIHDSSCICGYGYLHRIPGKADLEFFSDSSICCCFFADCEFTLASLAQWRWKTEAFPDILDMKDTVVNDPEWEKLTIKYHQINQWIDLVGKVQKKKAKINDRRVKLIMASMICFYLSIGSIVISFFIGVMKLRWKVGT